MLQAGALLAYGPVWFLVGVLHLCGRSHGGVAPNFLAGAFAPVGYCEEGRRTTSMPGSVNHSEIIPLPPTRVIDHKPETPVTRSRHPLAH